METAEPSGIDLSLEESFAFLNETAWVLENAGFLVSVPAWWTPEGRRRAKLCLRPAVTSKKAAHSATQSLLSLDQLLEYRYELTLGGERVGAEEWMQLVETKTPLVQFRGQWVVLDRERMKDMLEFWRRQGEAEETWTCAFGLSALRMRQNSSKSTRNAPWRRCWKSCVIHSTYNRSRTFPV